MRYIFLYLIFFFFSFFTSFISKAKDTLSLEYPSINYTTKDGLPSNETFCVFEDSRGYIWIGTDRGLVKYDGYEFKTYTTLDGLTDNVILALNEDDKGNIWYTGLNNMQLGYINPEMKFYNYKHHVDIVQLIEPFKYSTIHFNEIYFEGNDIYLVNRRYGYIIINNKGIKGVNLNRTGNLVTDLNIFHTENNNFVFSTYSSFGSSKGKYKSINVLNKRTNEVIYTLEKSIYRHLYPTLASRDSIDYIYEGIDQLVVNQSLVKHNKLNYLCSVFQISSNQFIFSVYNEIEENRILYYSNSPNVNDPKIKLKKGLRASSAIKDSRGGIWISSLRKGVLYIPNLSSKMAILDNPVEALYRVDSGLVLGTKSANYLNNIGSDFVNLMKSKLDYYDLYNIDSKFSFIGSITFNYSNSFITKEAYDAGILVKGIQNISDSLYYVWYPGYISKVIDSNIYLTSLWQKFNGALPRQTSFYCFKEDSCLFGTNVGLYTYFGDRIIDLEDEKESNIRHIEYLKDLGILVYSILGEGLVVRYKNGDKIKLTTKDGLVSNTINSIYKDSNSVLWIGTNKGVNSLKVSKNGNVSIETIVNASKNLSSPNILQIYYEDNILYLGTDVGFNIIDLKENKEKEGSQPLFIDNILVNDKLYDHLKEEIILPYDSNNITYYYLSIAFNMYGNINYRYKLKGQFDDWIYTKERKASFMNILPGEYYFELEAQDEFGQWVGLNQPHHLFIKTPFWQTWWFISGVIFIIISLIGGILFYYISNLKKERSYLENERLLSEELNESRQKALSAQLNPHFVFNSLNSIQNFILTKRTELSSDYLGMFSKLMRFVFENSKKLYVPLSDEVEALHLYLELEQVRHNHQFEYVINIEEGLNPRQVFMPSLLIQPIIENAIWHGLLHKQHGNKILEVSFKSKDELLVIEIKDNGVGRKKSIPKPKFIKKQKSSGVELTKQRLDLLSQSTGLKTSFEIIDLYDSHHTPNGTSVKISIPLNLS